MALIGPVILAVRARRLRLRSASHCRLIFLSFLIFLLILSS
jgi:hypothetical protein